MKVFSILLPWLLAVASGYADDRPMIPYLIGREFSIEDDWAGQELAFREREGSIVAVWRILGSGRPVISEVEYPIEVKSGRMCVFEVEVRDKSRVRVKVGIYPEVEVRVYLNGVRIHPIERHPREPNQTTSQRRPAHGLSAFSELLVFEGARPADVRRWEAAVGSS